MGTFITTAILTLIVLPLVLGAIIKAAGASGHYPQNKRLGGSESRVYAAERGVASTA